MPNFNAELGNYLKTLRVARGLSQEDVATEIGGLSAATISRFESGVVSIKLFVLIRYLNAVGVTFSEAAAAIEGISSGDNLPSLWKTKDSSHGC